MEEKKKNRAGLIISFIIIGICIVVLVVCIVLICNNYSGSIDEEALKPLIGSYTPVEKKTYLTLSIEENRFSCIDSQAGNPGVEGELYSVDENEIVVDVDMDYYEEMPNNDWKLDSHDRLVMSYELAPNGIYLTNSGKTVYFERLK